MKRTSTQNLVMCALCAAIICILAPISVPIGPVPISLATFAVMLSGALLGAKWGTIATAVYLLLGCIGVPVFAGYAAGVACLAGVTGGYLIGYLPLAFIGGLIYDLFGRNKSGAAKIAAMVIGMIAGTVVLYILGTAWFCFASGTGVIAALGLCVTPFLIGDAIKMVVVAIITPQIERALSKAGVGFHSANA